MHILSDLKVANLIAERIMSVIITRSTLGQISDISELQIHFFLEFSKRGGYANKVNKKNATLQAMKDIKATRFAKVMYMISYPRLSSDHGQTVNRYRSN